MPTEANPGDFKVLVLNAENLFLLSDQELTHEHLNLGETQWQRLSTSVYENKSLFKAQALAKSILLEDPDLVLISEVGGLESLKNFNHLFLQNRYLAALTEGNSDRNIDIGFLVRKNQSFYFDLISNRTRSLNFLYPHERQSVEAGLTLASVPANHTHRFSRDVAELHLFTKDREHPFLILLVAHLKSRLDPLGIDPNGFERRQAELKTLIQIYNELESRFQGKVPIAIGGDFNGQAGKMGTDPEFEDLYLQTQLDDVCELARLPIEDRATYYQVGRGRRSEGRQIDYCFLSPLMAQYLDPTSVHVHRYQDPTGHPMNPPSSMETKALLPSDHYPLVFQLRKVPIF